VFVAGAANADGGLRNPGTRAVVGGKAQRDTGTISAMADLASDSTGEESRAGAPRCRWTLAKDYFGLGQPLAKTERVETDGRRSVLYWRECAGVAQGSLVWVPQVAPEELAAQAADTVRELLPLPRGVFSPNLSAGHPAVVHVPLWFAVPAAQWEPVSATASVPGLAATVVARPTGLLFRPGDGLGTVECMGPGTTFRPGMQEPAKPPACSHTYSDASTVAPNRRTWPATLSIRWEVSWSASTGVGGSLGTLTTSTDYPVPASEIQAIEQAGVR
jgi:hypothetical protein